MAISVTKPEKAGIGLGIICNDECSFRWHMHQLKFVAKLPSGIFWTYIPALRSFDAKKGINYASERNEVVKRAKAMNLKYLMFLDTDVFCPIETVSKLLSNMSKDVKIVSGVYYKKNAMPIEPVVYKRWGNGAWYDIKNESGLQKMDTAGMGCVMIDMDVIDEFDRRGIPYFQQDWVYTRDNGQKTNVPLGEDFWFFTKAQELGFSCYVDTDIRCGHYDAKARQMWDETGITKFDQPPEKKDGDFIPIVGKEEKRDGNSDKRNKTKKSKKST